MVMKCHEYLLFQAPSGRTSEGGKGWEKGEMSRVSMWSRFGNFDGGLGLDEQLRGKKKMGEKTWEDIV